MIPPKPGGRGITFSNIDTWLLKTRPPLNVYGTPLDGNKRETAPALNAADPATGSGLSTGKACSGSRAYLLPAVHLK